MRNNNQSPRRGSSDNEQRRQWRPYLERLADRRTEQADDLEFDEKYWRERERLHAEKNLPPVKKAA
jgi:hypothetical protein